MKNRSTTDIVVIMLTGMILFVVIIGTLGMTIGRIIHPDLNISPGVELLSATVQTALGALVGYIGGRAQGRLEANGQK